MSHYAIFSNGFINRLQRSNTGLDSGEEAVELDSCEIPVSEGPFDRCPIRQYKVDKGKLVKITEESSLMKIEAASVDKWRPTHEIQIPKFIHQIESDSGGFNWPGHVYGVDEWSRVIGTLFTAKVLNLIGETPITLAEDPEIKVSINAILADGTTWTSPIALVQVMEIPSLKSRHYAGTSLHPIPIQFGYYTLTVTSSYISTPIEISDIIIAAGSKI